MKANELRLGNYVYGDDNAILKIARIETEQYAEWNSGNGFCIISQDKFGENDYYEDIVNPIPLTEEWLLKFGFELCENFIKGVYVNYWFKYPIKIKNSGKSKSIYFKGSEFSKHIIYVHQLQNLHFALTGEELTIKE